MFLNNVTMKTLGNPKQNLQQDPSLSLLPSN